MTMLWPDCAKQSGQGLLYFNVIYSTLPIITALLNKKPCATLKYRAVESY